MKAKQSVLYMEGERKEREPCETDELGEMKRESLGKRRGREREREGAERIDLHVLVRLTGRCP